MEIHFLGATETVTGSKFLLRAGSKSILVDCGLYQGYKWLRERNWQPLPFDVRQLDAVVLTHAHIDHSGAIPLLYQQGYRGPVFCHHGTKALCDIMLRDSAHLQEEDARFYHRHKLTKHEKPKPLYDTAAAVHSLELFQPVEFRETVGVGDISFYLQPAGHILGAGSLVVETEGKRIGFSGDVGRLEDIMMYPPKPLPELDLLLMESTYGNRLHSDVDPWQQLADVVNSTASAGGVLVVPSFAVGRAQTLQHMLTTLIQDERIPPLPIFLDSPMAIDVSELYCHYKVLHRLDASQCRAMCARVTYCESVAQSKALDDIPYPHIIIAGSGMATGGRVLHHLKRLLPDYRTTVLFTGFQAGGTRGARMLGGVESVKIHGEYIPCKAKVALLDGLSGHADYLELTRWLQQSSLRRGTQIELVHGEPDAADALRLYLKDHTGFRVNVAQYRHIFRL